MKNFINNKTKICFLILLVISFLSGLKDYNSIISNDMEGLCKFPTSKFNDILDDNDYNYCIGPFYYLRYRNDSNMTMPPISSSDKIEMGIWFLPGITIYEK